MTSEGVYYFPVMEEHGRKVVGKGLGPYGSSELVERVRAMDTLRKGAVTGSTTATEVYSARGKDMDQARWRVRDMLAQAGELVYPSSSQ